MKFRAHALCLLWLLVCPAHPQKQHRQYFEFHNNFWMSLHHTLFREAVATKTPLERQKQTGILPLPTENFLPEEKQAWIKSIEFYASKYAGRRLLFDEELVRINNALTLNQDESVLNTHADLPAILVDALRSAAPIYRKYWWETHKTANQDWIAAMRPQVDDLAPAVVGRLEQLLKDKWPSDPDRFDVTYYVSEVGGAYTTENPAHTTLASSRPDNSGLWGLETVFHEGAHLLTFHLQQALDHECKLQKKDCKDLWHAVQFFTVGQVVKAELALHGTSEFVPYAYKFGLYERGHWKAFLPALEKDWAPYIEGGGTFDQALKMLVTDIP